MNRAWDSLFPGYAAKIRLIYVFSSVSAVFSASIGAVISSFTSTVPSSSTSPPGRFRKNADINITHSSLVIAFFIPSFLFLRSGLYYLLTVNSTNFEVLNFSGLFLPLKRYMAS